MKPKPTQRSTWVRRAGNWFSVAMVPFAFVSCAAVNERTPDERVPVLGARSFGPTRTRGASQEAVHLLAFDTIYNPKTKEAVLAPTVLGWSKGPQGPLEAVTLSYVASTDINNEAARRVAAGVAHSIFGGPLTLGVRGFSTEAGNNVLLAGKLDLPLDTKFAYSVDPKLGSASQQFVLKHPIKWEGPVTTLFMEANGRSKDILQPRMGVDHAFGSMAVRGIWDMANERATGELILGVGRDTSQISVFASRGRDNDVRIGVGFQIPLFGPKSSKRQVRASKAGERPLRPVRSESKPRVPARGNISKVRPRPFGVRPSLRGNIRRRR